jgi:hypothetical protein
MKHLIAFNESLFFSNMTPKAAIEKARINIQSAKKKKNDALATKVEGQLLSFFKSIEYKWKRDPHALEILGEYV